MAEQKSGKGRSAGCPGSKAARSRGPASLVPALGRGRSQGPAVSSHAVACEIAYIPHSLAAFVILYKAS